MTHTELEQAIVWSDVKKKLGKTVALDGFSLAVPSGAITALLGPNGAGKSTAASLAFGIRKPDAGSVQVLGDNPWNARHGSLDVGSVPQDLWFPPTVKVRELVDFVAGHYPSPSARDTTLERAGLSDLADRASGGLSGGQRRRLGIALAICGNPRLLILDEPTVGLDSDARRALWEQLTQFRAEGGTILLATHDLDEAQRLADFVAVARKGRVIAYGSSTEMRASVGLVHYTMTIDPSEDCVLAAGVREANGRNLTSQLSGGRLSVCFDVPVAQNDRFLHEAVRSIDSLCDLRIAEASLEEAVDALASGPELLEFASRGPER